MSGESGGEREERRRKPWGVSRDPVVSLLSKYVENAWRFRGFCGIVIYGLQGVGKSTLALHVAARVVGSWQRVIERHLVFTIDELEQCLLYADKTDSRWRILVWDDAGAHASKYLPFSDVEKASWITDVVQLIREHCASLIITTPSPAMLLKSIREQPDWLRVKMRPFKLVPRQALVDIYTVKVDPLGRLRYSKLGENFVFNVHLPDNVYYRYRRVRKEYLSRAIPANRKRGGESGKIITGADESNGEEQWPEEGLNLAEKGEAET